MVAVYDVDVTVEGVPGNPHSQVQELEVRLARGYDMIEEHRLAGLSVVRLEEHWLGLLSDYENLVDVLDSSRY